MITNKQLHPVVGLLLKSKYAGGALVEERAAAEEVCCGESLPYSAATEWQDGGTRVRPLGTTCFPPGEDLLRIRKAKTMTASKLAITVIDTGNTSAIEDTLATSLRDAQSWSTFWKHHKSCEIPTPPLPEVDFEKEIVIIYVLGEKPRGSTWVHIESVEDDGKALNVAVATRSSTGPSTTVMCNPFTIIKVQADKSRSVNVFLRALRPEDIEL